MVLKYNDIKDVAYDLQDQLDSQTDSIKLLRRRLKAYSKTQEEYSRKLNEYAKYPKQERVETIHAMQTLIDQLQMEN